MTNTIKPKFTSGPWRVRDSGPQFCSLTPGSKMFVLEQSSPDELHIGFACSWINDPEDAIEAKANAHLLAAAPDLYEALANLENDAGQIPEHAWQMVQAALAKARGE